MLKHSSRSRMNSVKKKALEKSILQDMNFLSLKEFYNSIPDYSEINHLPEREFYRELDLLKRKQQQLTECKKPSRNASRSAKSDKSNSRSSHHFDFALGSNEYETKRNFTERISFADDGNSISSWQLEYDGTITCKKRDGSRLSSAASRPRTSRAGSRCRKQQQSRLSNVVDDYEMLNSLRNYRSKSISPARSQLNDCKKQKKQQQQQLEEENKFYSDITQDKLKSVDHSAKKDPMKNIPITSKIPLFKQVMEDMEHKSQLAKLDSAIKLQSQVKPFHFHETRSSARRCLSRSLSTPQLRGEDSENEELDEEGCSFKAKPFPKNLFCNYVHYKMWEDNYFRALSKKLRAEELLKLSKLPPSMAKREEEKKKCEKLDELELAQLEAATTAKQSVDFSPTAIKKKKLRRKLRKSKSAIGGTRSQFAKSFMFDTKRDRDKGSVKSDATTTTNTTKHRDTPCEKISPIYPVNRPNLAATLRYEWSREKIKRYKDVKENLMRDKFRKPSWGVKNMHAFQQLAHETTNDEEIAIRLATRKAEQKLRQEEHEMNMEMMKQRVKTAPLLLEGPTHLGPRLGHIYHHCDMDSDKNSNKMEKLMQQNNLLKPPHHHQHHHHQHHHHKSNRPASTISTDSKVTESTYNTKCTDM